jgi:hypothetical protein
MTAAAVPDVTQTVRQILAVLQDERRALAGLDLAGIVDCATRKGHLCEALAGADTAAIDAALHDLLASAARLNDGNARLRNLIAGKVSTRLTALTGRSSLYRVNGGNAMRARMALR